MSHVRRYIIIDDDSFTNEINSMTIEFALGEADIQKFTAAEDALEYLLNEFSKSLQPAILLLDINMPAITGWEFMEQFEKLSEPIKNSMRVYILSSSVDRRDKERTKANKYIKGFVCKPLEPEIIVEIAAQ